MAKFDNDAAVQVAEEAFRAGFQAGFTVAEETSRSRASAENDAWDEFEPSEDVKALVG